METKKVTNLSKRQQISASNKTVFVWVAAASIVASFSVVAIIFLFGQITFNQKVIGAKQKTESNLIADLQIANPAQASDPSLRDSVNVLRSNPELNLVKTGFDSSNLQVVFDALPTSYDSANFGASLQNVLLAGAVASIESLSVTADPNANSTGLPAGVTPGPQPIAFRLTITGSADQIKTALGNMEASIRPIKVIGLTIDGGTPLTARITGQTYYDPPVNLSVTTKVIKP